MKSIRTMLRGLLWPVLKANAVLPRSEDLEPPDMVREYAVMVGEYGRAQQRCSRLLAQQAAEIEQLQAQRLRLRAALIQRESLLLYSREDRAVLMAAQPGLPKRVNLVRQVERLLERLQDLLRERGRREFGGAAVRRMAVVDLQAKAVLCIAADETQINAAQRVTEWAGGQFTRHVGRGSVDDDDGLEASLVAADLVICQTGCLSHGAYWRVREHCRRTGKQCVLLDQQGRDGAGAQAIQIHRKHDAAQDQAL